jgi:hypothetical protein
MDSPVGVAVDTVNDTLFVAHLIGFFVPPDPKENGTITVHARTASGDTPPLRKLEGVSTRLGSPTMIALAPAPKCPDAFDFDFSGTQYADCFRDVHRGTQIEAGLDVTTGHAALVFTGLTGSAGATWLTVYDATPTTPAPGPTFGAQTVCADVLFSRFNNLKGAGLVALLNEGVGQRGLALVVADAGNTDVLRLATVEGDPAKQGKLAPVASVPLRSGVAEHAWYRLVMTVDPATPRVTGKVYAHTAPLDPDSELAAQVGPTLTYGPAALPEGVSSPGQNGILAQAISAAVDLSVTNFTNDAARCEPAP